MDKCFHIMQGDSYPIEFAFYDEETGKKITNSEVSKIEFILGNTRKVYPEVGNHMLCRRCGNRYFWTSIQNGYSRFLRKPPIQRMRNVLIIIKNGSAM